MTKKKIDILLKWQGATQSDIANGFSVSKQSMNRKIKNSKTAFDLSDLIKLANLTGTKLAFIDENDKPVITFDMTDLEETTNK